MKKMCCLPSFFFYFVHFTVGSDWIGRYGKNNRGRWTVDDGYDV